MAEVAPQDERMTCQAHPSMRNRASTVNVLPRPHVSMEQLSMETCGGQEALILLRLRHGNPPWSVTLRLPDGSLKEIGDIIDRTYVYQTLQV